MESGLKYALVTGASSGIGWHISEEMAKRGYSVIAVSNQPEQLISLKNKLENSYHIPVLTLNIDLALEDSALQVFGYCEKQGCFVEVLINNAGTLIFGEAVKVEYQGTKSILNLHITTPALLCRLFGEQMIQRRKGFILNVSSISSVMPYPTLSLYGPTKAFLRDYSRALRTEMRRYGVSVTCLLPGATVTSLYDPGRYNTPLKRKLGIIKNPDEVAGIAVSAMFNNKAESVPGVVNKLIVLLLPLVPHSLIAWIYRKKDLTGQ